MIATASRRLVGESNRGNRAVGNCGNHSVSSLQRHTTLISCYTVVTGVLVYARTPFRNAFSTLKYSKHESRTTDASLQRLVRTSSVVRCK